MNQESPIKTVSLTDLRSRFDRGETKALVNVLTADYFAKYSGARIPGSHWIPLDEVEVKFPLLFNKDEEIVVYCGGPQCPQSVKAAEALGRLGFRNVVAFEGGLKEWMDAGLPLQSACTTTAGVCRTDQKSGCTTTSCSQL